MKIGVRGDHLTTLKDGEEVTLPVCDIVRHILKREGADEEFRVITREGDVRGRNPAECFMSSSLSATTLCKNSIPLSAPVTNPARGLRRLIARIDQETMYLLEDARLIQKEIKAEGAFLNRKIEHKGITLYLSKLLKCSAVEGGSSLRELAYYVSEKESDDTKHRLREDAIHGLLRLLVSPDVAYGAKPEIDISKAWNVKRTGPDTEVKVVEKMLKLCIDHAGASAMQNGQDAKKILWKVSNETVEIVSHKGGIVGSIIGDTGKGKTLRNALEILQFFVDMRDNPSILNLRVRKSETEIQLHTSSYKYASVAFQESGKAIDDKAFVERLAFIAEDLVKEFETTNAIVSMDPIGIDI